LTKPDEILDETWQNIWRNLTKYLTKPDEILDETWRNTWQNLTKYLMKPDKIFDETWRNTWRNLTKYLTKPDEILDETWQNTSLRKNISRNSNVPTKLIFDEKQARYLSIWQCLFTVVYLVSPNFKIHTVSINYELFRNGTENWIYLHILLRQIHRLTSHCLQQILLS
jgi:hypothetical protein